MKQALNIPKYLMAPWLLRATCAAVEGLMFLCYSAVIIIYTSDRWPNKCAGRCSQFWDLYVPSTAQCHLRTNHTVKVAPDQVERQITKAEVIIGFAIIVRTVLPWFFFPLLSLISLLPSSFWYILSRHPTPPCCHAGRPKILTSWYVLGSPNRCPMLFKTVI